MENKEIEEFKIKLKWKIYHGNFNKITKFNFSTFKFNFKIQSQIQQEEFVEFICSKDLLLPWKLCNFFIKRNIKFSLRFRYLKTLKLKGNLNLLKCVLELNIKYLKFKITKLINNFKFINTIDKNSILIEILNKKQKSCYFIQADCNIWWRPRKTVKASVESNLVSIGWLFVQIGKIKFNKI